MSKKVNLLLDEPCPELLCGICSDVLEDPVQVHCPEDHMFCSKCIHSHVEFGQATCPICFTILDRKSFQLSKFVARQIGRLRIQCCYVDNGCLWQGLFSDNHISECEFKPCVCPNSINGCLVDNLSQKSKEEHLKVCLYQELSCPNNVLTCRPFLRRDTSLHENECASYACPYAIEGCPFVATLPQVTIHCDGYCGRLHKKVQDLEMECKRLNNLIQEVTIGLNSKLPSTPEDSNHNNNNTKQHDTSMDEMALFHQMFSSDPFGALDLNDKSTDTAMDMNNLPDLSFLDSVFDTATSPQPLQFIPPVNVPKRTSHGKKIRYSKNVRLAHSALRMARQRTASNTTNPSNDAILNNLDIAKQKSQITFKNMEDLTEFLNDNDTLNKNKSITQAIATNTNTITTTSSSLSSSSPPPQPHTSQSVKSPPSTTNATTTSAAAAAAAATTSTTSVPKRRPMFILASSYLSNYNTNNDKPL